MACETNLTQSSSELEPPAHPPVRLHEVTGTRKMLASRAGALALLGDSTLDNKLWVAKREPSVTEHLRGKLNNHGSINWAVHNLAVDGALVRAVPSQLEATPSETTHFVVSVGGNNGLGFLGYVENGSVCGLPWRLCCILWLIWTDFRAEYEAAIDLIQARSGGARLIMCSLYGPCMHGRFALGGPRLRRLVRKLVIAVGVWALNRVVGRAAKRRRLPLIDLRAIFNSEWDYANPIEPSAQGGDKISENILHILQTHDFDRGEHRVFALVSHTCPPYPYGASVRGEDKSAHLCGSGDGLAAQPSAQGTAQGIANNNRSAQNDAYRAFGLVGLWSRRTQPRESPPLPRP